MASTQTLTKAALIVLLGASGFFFYQANKFERQASDLDAKITKIQQAQATDKTAVVNTDVKGTEAKSTEAKGTEAKNTEAKNTEAAKTAPQGELDYQAKMASLEKEIKSLQEQLLASKKKVSYLQGKLSKSGFGYLPCWIPEEGESTRYIIKVTVNSPNSVTVVPAWPDESYKVKAEEVKPIMEMIEKKDLSMNDFLALGQEVNNNYIRKGTEDECRYFVILDNNKITDRKQADLARLRVSSLFYIYETR